MPIQNALASVPVKDMISAVLWYEKLFGRPANSRQKDLAEWRFEMGGALQVYPSAERAGTGAFTLAVSSLAEQVENLRRYGLDAGKQINGEKVKVVMIKDLDGNSIAFSEAV